MDVEKLKTELTAWADYIGGSDVEPEPNTDDETLSGVLRQAAAALAKLQAERDEAIDEQFTVDENGVSIGWEEVAAMWRSRATHAEARAEKAEAERDEAQAALEVCRESLVDQAAARADPAMPLLVASVRERLEGESEAVYAMSESREDRIYAHGLSLLCDWQKAAASRALGGGE